MTIEFNLTGLHPSYERPVRDVLRGLDADYPYDCVESVSLFEEEGNESLACVKEPKRILLNRRWFGISIDELRESARIDDLIQLGGLSMPIQWHGGMEEPHHVLTHEFGHCLADQIPGWRDFIQEHWEQSCADPINCRPPSGYSLATVDEFWADCFAAMRLNYPSQVGDLLASFLIKTSKEMC